MRNDDLTELEPDDDLTLKDDTDQTIVETNIDVRNSDSQRSLNSWGTKNVREIYHLPEGTILKGKYDIYDVLGFGGFGVVYKAWDRVLNRYVAIKEYFPTIYLNRVANSTEVAVYDKKKTELFRKGVEEFLEEARNIARFNTHPNIVHIYDYFEENGTAYFVMELLEGMTVKEIIRQAHIGGTTICLEEALRITGAVLNALEATHSVQIIHRDIKPGNIYVLNNGTVKVYDFGAARFSDQDQERTRTVVITPGYAPPEQYQKKSKQGAFTDIYAVGAMLYEMLTGMKPEESVNRKIHDELQAPHEINPTVPLRISNVVMRAMAVQPEIRFQSAGEFAKALESLRQIRDDKKEMRYRKRRRNLRICGLLLMIALAVTGCLYLYYSSYREAVLAEAELEVWVPTKNGDTETTETLYQTAFAEYCEDNPQITVSLRVLDEENYAAELAEALESGSGPDVFDSTLLDNPEAYKLASLGKLFAYESFAVDDYWFLTDYTEYFSRQDQLPLSFDVPVVYENSRDEDLAESEDYESYIAGESAYQGMISDYERVQADMPGKYIIRETQDTSRCGYFTNCWSINAASGSAEQQAAVRLLYYLLSDTAQQELVLDGEEYLPINKNIWEVFLEINPDFEYLEDALPSVQMGKR